MAGGFLLVVFYGFGAGCVHRGKERFFEDFEIGYFLYRRGSC